MALPEPEKANAPPGRRGAAIADLGPGQQSHHTRDAGLVARWECLRRGFADSDLQGSDIRVLFAIVDRINAKTGFCYPSIARLMSDSGLSKASVARSIGKLVERRYIEKKSGSYTSANEYRLGCLTSETSVTNETTQADETRLAGDAGVVQPVRPDHVSSVSNQPAEANQSNEPADPFERFWLAYPRRDARKKAVEAWERLQLDSVVETILADVADRRADPDQWQDRKFIPLPASYLDGARWQDQWRGDNAAATEVRAVLDPHAEERRALDDQLYTLRHDRDVTQLIDPLEYEAKAAPILAKLRQLNPSINSQPSTRP